MPPRRGTGEPSRLRCFVTDQAEDGNRTRDPQLGNPKPRLLVERKPLLMKPGSEKLFDLATASWGDQAGADTLSFNDHERWCFLDSEAIDQLGLCIHIDAVEAERLVVLTPLEHL
jgi:hypothetical protein